MYVAPPPVLAASEALWSFLRDDLRSEGFADVPDRLSAHPDLDHVWLHPDLLLAQTCGYPYVQHLRGRVRLVATPAYLHQGCDGPRMCSFVIVPKASPIGTLEDLRGKRAAINGPDSNSGTNLFRATIAPLSLDARFFASVMETGSHVASIDAVASLQADAAAIDCITYGNVGRFEPERLANVRILSTTTSTPGLPLVTRAGASDAEIAALRRSLKRSIEEPGLADARNALSLKDFCIVPDEDYEQVAELARFAHRLGYPTLA
ncbi:phosphate/phosphite/phosphonate ABC transporter substrate-binding protein [Ensifer sp.]|jgi:ABC-type phosphate/phosphonate transport system substrate-binding protein|uniref:phosphate/phosphite/phosphonate ABC transporter substrate-binding protein n=1 Tax=Ensifer sp. TaxID=1872086 RepID=UPI002E13C235|nr:PhnD/SsuA/transferrin family substrate-binding protein [Ensifer sp.]